MPVARSGSLNAATHIESLEPLVLMSASAMTDGTASDDVLIALDDCEVLNGDDGNDTLIALVGNNVLNGGAGDDELVSARTDNVLNGGEGSDTAVYWSTRDRFTVSVLTDGSVEVTNGRRTDRLTNVEYIRFDDETIAVSDLPGHGPEYRSIDGTGNNLAAPELGSTNEQLGRLSQVEYGDGLSSPAGDTRPSARTISNELAAQVTSSPNARGLTDMAWLWGQFLDHDIDLTEAAEPHESYPINVPTGDSHFDPAATGTQTIELNRSIYDAETSVNEPRQQINQITAFIDGSNVYGSDNVRADALRSFDGGQLRTSDGNLLPFNDVGLPNAGGTGDELFLAGDIRANENAALTSMHTLWVREHNRIAMELAADDDSLDDEQLYQQARKQVIAQLQHITFNEFLPALLGVDAIEQYSGYDATVDPSIANEFSTAAYRFGHTMLTAELLRLNNDGSVIDDGNLPLREAFFAPDEVSQNGIAPLLIGTSGKAANEIDNMIVDDVRNFLFGPPGAGGFDLASLNIQRGRDHGLADYNQVRNDLGLTPVASFADITSDESLQQKLADVYGDVNEIDLWVAGLAEDHVPGSSMGETFRAILLDQFTRLRDGDRFWYENSLTADELAEIETTSLSDVIERNTIANGLQDNVFFLPVNPVV